jgi:hypothetical protein
MTATRERKRDPHRCATCSTLFEVTYFDDRASDRTTLPALPVDVACPQCGRAKSIMVPAGAERTIVVERDEDGEAEEGGGG